MNKKILTVTLNPAIDFTIEIPNFKINSVNRVTNSRRDPGGKGINVATALTNGGIETYVTGFLGNDNKDIFLKHFKKESINNNFIYVKGNTREGIKIADIKEKSTTDINFNGIDLNKDDIEKFIIHYTDIIRDFDYVILSGSLPKNVNDSIYVTLAHIAKDCGVYVVLDTSGTALLKAINSCNINIIKPNIDELIEIFPEYNLHSNNYIKIDKLMLKILKNVDIVILSLGKEGSRVYTKDFTYKANAPEIDILSTVGAGDSFLAGFIFGMLHEKEMKSILKTAVSWAASKLTIFGPGLSTKKPPAIFIKDILIEEV